MKTILVTGGAGFIGSNFIRYTLKKYPNISIINYDKLTYSGNLNNLSSVPADRYLFKKGDICSYNTVSMTFYDHSPIDAVIHFAAESHVDRSIQYSREFILTNILGTQILLDVALNFNCPKFIHVSTDEVYGSLKEEDPSFTENNTLAPNSPYSASKASSDLLVRAYFKTHGFPGIITRCSNNYGPYQFPEKFIPLMITNIIQEKPIPVYDDGLNIRDWIHVTDHCTAILTVLMHGVPGEIYNIGANNEHRNINIVKKVLKILEKPDHPITFEKDFRPGHDFRYAVNSEKIRKLGWKPQTNFDEGLKDTITWYYNNMDWWTPLLEKRKSP